MIVKASKVEGRRPFGDTATSITKFSPSSENSPPGLILIGFIEQTVYATKRTINANYYAGPAMRCPTSKNFSFKTSSVFSACCYSIEQKKRGGNHSDAVRSLTGREKVNNP